MLCQYETALISHKNIFHLYAHRQPTKENDFDKMTIAFKKNEGILMKRKDTYQQWKSSGQLEAKLKQIKELAAKCAGMEVIASVLGISENTLYSLRKKYKDINNAYNDGRNQLKQALLNKMFERAMGLQITDEITYIEQTATGTKKKITKHVKTILPDMSVARYLLIINFGHEYSEKKYEYENQQKRLELKNNENEWKPLEITDANSNQKDK